MSTAGVPDELQLTLPISVTGRMHLSRMIRELESLDNDFETQKARDRDSKAKIPTMSQTLADCVELNKVDILSGHSRMQLKKAMNLAKDKAPTIHFTFASEADPRSLQQLAAYVRKEIHPQALLSIGLQPSLVGGVYIRTPNQVHDFSLKALLRGKRNVITSALADGIIKSQQAPAATPEQIKHEVQQERAIESVEQKRVTIVAAPAVMPSAPSSGSASAGTPGSPAPRATTPAPTRTIQSQQPDGWPERRSTAQPVARQPIQSPPATRGSHAK